MGSCSHEIENEILDILENINDDKENTNPLDDTFINPSKSYSCKKCEFVAKNASGLKTDIKRKHQNHD